MKTFKTLTTAALTLALSLTAVPAAAQNWLFKVGGGLASQYGSARPVGAYKIGVAYEHEFDQHWTFSPGIAFVGKGWKDPDTMVPALDDNGDRIVDEDGNEAFSRMNRSTSACYIEVPLLFSYYFRLGESRYWVVSAGPYAALGVAGKVKTKGDGTRTGSEKLYYDGKTFDEDGARRFDAGIQTYTGYRFASGLSVGVEADFSLTRFKSGGGRNVAGLIALGYSF